MENNPKEEIGERAIQTILFPHQCTTWLPAHSYV